jgi:hypothetical protein
MSLYLRNVPFPYQLHAQNCITSHRMFGERKSLWTMQWHVILVMNSE